MFLEQIIWPCMAVYGRVASYGSIIWRIVALYRLILPYIALNRTLVRTANMALLLQEVNFL